MTVTRTSATAANNTSATNTNNDASTYTVAKGDTMSQNCETK